MVCKQLCMLECQECAYDFSEYRGNRVVSHELRVLTYFALITIFPHIIYISIGPTFLSVGIALTLNKTCIYIRV